MRSWCTSDPRNKTRAKCLLCSCTISITEGFSAITKHFHVKKHQERQEDSQKNPNFQWPTKQLDMFEGIATMEEQAREGRKKEEQKLVAQLRMVMAYWFHGCSRSMFNCSADLFPKIFQPCEVLKIWDLRYSMSLLCLCGHFKGNF